MKRKVLSTVALAYLIFSPLSANRQSEELDVPYVPTPKAVVEEMLRLAEINENDILYDLGCGDGRILITAAVKYGIRGVGVDLDPKRIKESRESARKAGVEHLVEFHNKNLFETDLHEASIVTLYLLPSVNVKLRPKLLNEVKPGTQVISHDFSMKEWLEDKSIQVGDDEQIHMVYYWVVPANVTGIWNVSFNTPLNGSHPEMFQFEQIFQFPQGSAFIKGSDVILSNVTLTGSRISFSMRFSGQNWEFEGSASGDVMRGTARISGNGETVSWTARRDPETKIPLDPNSLSFDPLKLDDNLSPRE
ncbi:MAG: SAM-dependent methyltransferase [Candidatus Aminicenantaceae bacterium]